MQKLQSPRDPWNGFHAAMIVQDLLSRSLLDAVDLFERVSRWMLFFRDFQKIVTNRIFLSIFERSQNATVIPIIVIIRKNVGLVVECSVKLGIRSWKRVPQSEYDVSFELVSNMIRLLHRTVAWCSRGQQSDTIWNSEGVRDSLLLDCFKYGDLYSYDNVSPLWMMTATRDSNHNWLL